MIEEGMVAIFSTIWSLNIQFIFEKQNCFIEEVTTFYTLIVEEVTLHNIFLNQKPSITCHFWHATM